MDNFLPYTYHRIRRIFLEEYALHVEKMEIYKRTRYNRPALYYLKDDDGKIVMQYVTLDALRIHLTTEGYPLHADED